MVRLEVCKPGPGNVENATRVCLNVDSALYRVRTFNFENAPAFQSGTKPPLDMGNVETKPNLLERRYGVDPSTRKNGQRRKDLDK